MEIGNIRKKAHPFLVYFVFMCIVVTVGLLYIMQKTENVVDTIHANSINNQ